MLRTFLLSRAMAVGLDYLCFGIEQKESSLKDFKDEINAGIFEVLLRRVKTKEQK